MISEVRPEAAAVHGRLHRFMEDVGYPSERVYVEQHAAMADRWSIPPVMEELKAAARRAGLWNLWLPQSDHGAGLTNREYAPLCETMGRSAIAPVCPPSPAVQSRYTPSGRILRYSSDSASRTG